MKRLLVALVLIATGAAWVYSLQKASVPRAPEGEKVAPVSAPEPYPTPAPERAKPIAVKAIPAKGNGLAGGVADQRAPILAAGVPMSKPQFEEEAVKTLAGLPQSQELRALPAEDIHRTPKALIDAGVEIGKMADAIEKNPALSHDGLVFYGKCARQERTSITARALCVVNLRELAGKMGKRADESRIDAEVLRLADKLKK